LSIETRLAYFVTRMLPQRQRKKIMRMAKGIAQRKDLAGSDVILISFPKSGRTWFRVLLSRCYAKSFGLDENTLIKRDNFQKLDPRAPLFMSFHGTFLSEVSRGEESSSLLAGKKIIFLVRNPIDVSVSVYFHRLGERAKSTGRDMKVSSGPLKGVSVEDFVLNSSHSVPEIIRFMNRWAELLGGHPEAIMVRYEDLRSDPVREMKKIAAFLGNPFTDEAIEGAVQASSFETLREQERRGQFANNALKPRDPANPNSYKVRRGKVKGYVDYLSEDGIRTAENLVASQLAKKLNYGILPASFEEGSRTASPADTR
jgi:hypothetical protein